MPSSLRCFPLDDLLRDHGWHIVARPAAGEATWQRGNAVLSESQAVATLPAALVESALEAGAPYAPL